MSTTFAPVPTTSKKPVKFIEPLAKSFGDWNGMKIIAIGKNGGKIVGYDAKGKPIYAASDAAKKLAAHKQHAQEHATKGIKLGDPTNENLVDEWLKHLGFEHKIAGGAVSMSTADALKITDAFDVPGTFLGAGKTGFTIGSLLWHVGHPLKPKAEALTTFAAAMSAGTWEDPPFPQTVLAKLKVLQNTSMGSHGVKKVVDDKGKFVAVWKPNDLNIARAEEAFARVAQLVFPKPSLYAKGEVVDLAGSKGALLSVLEGADNVIGPESGHGISKENLKKVANRLAQHHVLDWMMSNHDGHGGNFFFTPDGDVGALDKGQAFKWAGSDSLDLDYNPNNKSKGTAYQQLWKGIQNGTIKVDEKKIIAGIAEVIASVEANLSIEQYKAILQPYFDEMGPSAGKKWNALQKRFQNLRTDFEGFLTTVFGHPVKLPVVETVAPAVTSVSVEVKVDPKTGVGKVTNIVAAPPAQKPIAIPGWPMTKGKVTVHHPGDPPPSTWPAKYPGPGYVAVVDYKGGKYKFEFSANEKGKPSVTVSAEGAIGFKEIASGMTIQQAADVPTLLGKGLNIWMTSTEKQKLKIGYSAGKLFQIDAFAEEFKTVSTLSTTVAEETPKQLEEQGVIEPETKTLSVHEMLKQQPDGVITDTALLPVEVQDFVKAHGQSKVGPDWGEHLPPGSVVKLPSGSGGVLLVSVKVGTYGAPVYHLWNLLPTGTGVNGDVSAHTPWVKKALALPEVQTLIAASKQATPTEVEKVGSAPVAIPETPPVETQLTIGQKFTTTSDYASAPIGTKVTGPSGHVWTKTAADKWVRASDSKEKTSFAMGGGPEHLVLSYPLSSSTPEVIASVFVTVDDYANAPIGTMVATTDNSYVWTKVTPDGWKEKDDDSSMTPTTNKGMASGDPLKFWGANAAAAAPKIEVPKNAPTTHAGPLAPQTKITVTKKGVGEVVLTVKDDGTFNVWFKGLEGNPAGVDFKSLSAACDHVWVVQQPGGYKDAADYKKKNNTNKVPSGGGWKFWGLKAAPPMEATSGTSGEATPAVGGNITAHHTASFPNMQNFPKGETLATPAVDASEEKKLLDAAPVGSTAKTLDVDGVAIPFTKQPDGSWTGYAGYALSSAELVEHDGGGPIIGSGKYEITPPTASALNTAYLDAHPVGTTVKTEDGLYTKVPGDEWKLHPKPGSYGSYINAATMAEHYGDNPQVLPPHGEWKLPGSMYFLGWMKGTQFLAGDGTIYTKDDDANGTWVSSEGSSLTSKELAEHLKDTEVAQILKPVAQSPAVVEPPPVHAQVSANAPVQPAKLVTDLDAIPPSVKEKVQGLHSVAQGWLNNPTAGADGKTSAALKSPLWASWVPPPGTFIEGDYNGEKVFFTTTSAGYTVGEPGGPAALVQFAIVKADGSHAAHPKGAQADPLKALSMAFYAAFPEAPLPGNDEEAWKHLSGIFNLDGASFPANTTYLGEPAPPVAAVVTKTIEETPASEKAKVVTKKVALVDVLGLADTKTKYGTITKKPVTGYTTAKKYPNSYYLTLKGNPSKDVNVAKLTQFLADHAVPANLVTSFSVKGSYTDDGAWVAVHESALQHEVAVTTTLEEAAVTAPETTPQEVVQEGAAWVPALTEESLTSAPDGTQLHFSVKEGEPSTSKWLKVGPSWFFVDVDGKVAPSGTGYSSAAVVTTKQILPHATIFNSFGEQLATFFTPAPSALPKKVSSKADLDALPAGTKIVDSEWVSDGKVVQSIGDVAKKYTFVKMATGHWMQASTGALKTSEVLEYTPGNTYDVMETGVGPAVASTPLYVGWSGAQQGSAVGAEAFQKFPVGTVVQEEAGDGLYWVKTPHGKWLASSGNVTTAKKAAAEAGYLSGVSSEAMADSLHYVVVEVPGAPSTLNAPSTIVTPTSVSVDDIVPAGLAPGETKSGDELGLAFFQNAPVGTKLKVPGGHTYTKESGGYWLSSSGSPFKSYHLVDSDKYQLVAPAKKSPLFPPVAPVESAAPTTKPAWVPPFKTVSATWKTMTLAKKLADVPLGAKIVFSDGTYVIKEDEGNWTQPTWQLYSAEGNPDGAPKHLKSYDNGVGVLLMEKGSGKLVGPGGVVAAPKPKPKAPPLPPKQKTPEELAAEMAKKAEITAKLAKAKEFTDWQKAHPAPSGDVLKALAHAAAGPLSGKAAAAGFFAYTDGASLLLGSADFDALKQSVDNWTGFPPHMVVDTPLGKMLKVPTTKFTALFPQLGTIVGPDGQTYPYGTTFETKQVPKGTKLDELKKEPGFYKFQDDDNGDATKKAIKWKVPGYSQSNPEAKAKAIAAVKEKLAKFGIEAHVTIPGAQNIITLVPAAPLSEALGFQTETVATPPPPVPFAKIAPLPFVIGPQKQGEHGIENKADLSALDMLKLGAWGHSVRCGDPGVLRHSHLRVKKVVKDGAEFIEVMGDLMQFDQHASKLKLGKLAFNVSTSPGVFDHDSGKHTGLTTQKTFSGMVGKTSSGTSIEVGVGDTLAVRNQFIVRIPAGGDYETELKAALALAVGEEKAERAVVQHDADLERIWIKSKIVRSGLGPKGYWDYPSDLSKYGDEKWLDSQLEKLGLAQFVATAKIEVGPGGAHHVTIEDHTDEEIKQKVPFLCTYADPDWMVEHIGNGEGVPARRNGYFNGTCKVAGASVGEDEASGGAWGLMTSSASPTSMPNSSASHHYIYHPRVLKRTDYHFHHTDGFGCTSKTSKYGGKAEFSQTEFRKRALAKHYEVNFLDGIALKDVAGVRVSTPYEKKSWIESFQKRFPNTTHVNGMPLDEFVFVSHGDVDSVLMNCKGLKDGVLP